MASLLSSIIAFLLNHNVGRGILVVFFAALVAAALQAILSILPSDMARGVWSTLCLGILVIVLLFYTSLCVFSHMRKYIGTGADLHSVYRCMPTAHRPPRPPVWAYGSHIQFVPWIIYNTIASWLVPLEYERTTLRVCQLLDKSRPASDTNTRSIEDVVMVNYFPPASNGSAETKQHKNGFAYPPDTPAILIEPGLTCTAQDVPGSSLMRLAVSRGFRIVVVERRGHAQPLAQPRWNLFGDSDDAEQIIKAVQKKLPGAPLFWVGYSSGSKLIIEGTGKFDERHKEGDMSAPRFVATACICPGYNLETCFMGFKFPYTRICLSSTKSKFLLENEALLRSHDVNAYEEAMNSKDLQSLLSHVAPFAGYPSAKEYFAAENPVLYAPLITTPTLIINSMDDPCTIPANAYGKMPGREDGLTFTDMVEKSPCGLLLMPPSGSHCPFLDGFFPFAFVPRILGGFVLTSWADSCVLEFFEGYLKETCTATAKK